MARLAAWDWRGHLRLESFRDETTYEHYGLELGDVEARMQLVSLRDGKKAAGYAAFRRLARLIPPMWPLRVLFAMGTIGGIGDRIYDRVARRRFVEKRVACDASCGINK